LSLTHFGFPGVCRTYGSKGLLAVYRASEGHDVYTGGGRGRILGRKSGDAGRTWGPEFLVYDQGLHDSRDPTLTRLSTGRILCAFFRYSPNDGPLIVYSDDDGDTWSAPVRLDATATHEYVCGAPVEMPNGDVLLVSYFGNTQIARQSSRLWKSTDQGQTWTAVTVIADGNDPAYDFHFQEPNLLLLDNGTLLCSHRTSSGRIRFARSTDDGATWTISSDTSLVASGRPHMFQHDNGSVTLVCRKGAVAYATSWDRGETWADWAILDSSPDGGTMVYAQTAEMGTNLSVCVYGLESAARLHASIHVAYLFASERAGADPLVADGKSFAAGSKLMLGTLPGS
jgi:hypothetical protein